MLGLELSETTTQDIKIRCPSFPGKFLLYLHVITIWLRRASLFEWKNLSD
jgi:hypothetical protein